MMPPWNSRSLVSRRDHIEEGSVILKSVRVKSGQTEGAGRIEPMARVHRSSTADGKMRRERPRKGAETAARHAARTGIGGNGGWRSAR
jgi:hypothetical protein